MYILSTNLLHLRYSSGVNIKKNEISKFKLFFGEKTFLFEEQSKKYVGLSYYLCTNHVMQKWTMT